MSDADLMAVISLRNHEKALGRHPSAEEEEDDEDSDSELEDQTGNGSAPSDAPFAEETQEATQKGLRLQYRVLLGLGHNLAG